MAGPPDNRSDLGAEGGARRPSALRELLRSESGSGLVLMVAAALALFVANSPLAPDYFGALEFELAGWSLLHWINDALMALFFLLVGLELKREFVDGELASWRRRLLPGVAALGGMIVPAIIFIAVNRSDPAALRGWAIPTATDIAFALGVLALFGRRVPVSLKLFLTALAIIDDLGAVAIIASFYSTGLSAPWLAAAAAATAISYLLNKRGVEALSPYLALGALLWVCVLQSGVHPTIAGVLLALTIPIRRSPARPDDATSPLHRLEHRLHPWVGYGIVPLFGFANAGVAITSNFAGAPAIPLGIALALAVGKPIGVFAFAWLAIRSGHADRPRDASAGQLFGVAALTGIGFTMSLFIGLLAFPGAPALQDEVKIGVLGGSLLSMLIGSIVLLASNREQRPMPSR